MTAPFCAIDFGTSNSAVAVPDGGAMRLVELEPGFATMPTAVFYPGASDRGGSGEAAPCQFGRAAIAAYVDGIDAQPGSSSTSRIAPPSGTATAEVDVPKSIAQTGAVIGQWRGKGARF